MAASVLGEKGGLTPKSKDKTLHTFGRKSQATNKKQPRNSSNISEASIDGESTQNDSFTKKLKSKYESTNLFNGAHNYVKIMNYEQKIKPMPYSDYLEIVKD